MGEECWYGNNLSFIEKTKKKKKMKKKHIQFRWRCCIGGLICNSYVQRVSIRPKNHCKQIERMKKKSFSARERNQKACTLHRQDQSRYRNKESQEIWVYENEYRYNIANRRNKSISTRLKKRYEWMGILFTIFSSFFYLEIQ